jgi:ribosome-binding protein aMBF1 (putative translation factor)
MTENCEVCGKEEKVAFEYVNCSYSPEWRLRVCGDCMNLLANEEWDQLTYILETRKQISTDKSHKENATK